MANETPQSGSPVFLGGACGSSTWRKEIAIPILEAAGAPYFDPQLPEGAWTPEHQYREMEIKNAASVWLFVISGETRGVASIGEVAYRIGQEGKIALALEDIPRGAIFEGRAITQQETDDLNRGRVFLRAMAEAHGVPVFSSIAEATHHAVALFRQSENELSEVRLKNILERIQLPGFHFTAARIGSKFCIQIKQETINTNTGQPEQMEGRQWLLDPAASEAEVVRTVLKAALTWQEHELREEFRLDNRQIFYPHFQLPDKK